MVASGFQFSFSTETWALGKPPWDWHLDAVGRALAQSLDTLGPGPGSTVDLLGDFVSHFPIATLSSVLRKMGTLFPTLPTSQIKRERGVPRALKRIMGRQGVIMALVSNPLNSLKTRERGQETERSWAACSPCQVSQACWAAREGRELQGGEAGQPGPVIQPLLCQGQGCCEPGQGVSRCPGSPLVGAKTSSSPSAGVLAWPSAPWSIEGALQEVHGLHPSQAKAGQGWVSSGGSPGEAGDFLSRRLRGQRSASSPRGGQVGVIRLFPSSSPRSFSGGAGEGGVRGAETPWRDRRSA